MEVEGRNKQKVAAGVQIFEDALHPPVGRLLQEAVHQLLGLLRLGEVYATDERCVGEVLRASDEVLGELCVLAREDPHLGGDFIFGSVVHQRVDPLQGLEHRVSIH